MKPKKEAALPNTAEEVKKRVGAEKWASGILDAMGETVLIYDLQGKLIQANTLFTKTMNIDPAEIIGKTSLEAGIVTKEGFREVVTRIIPELMKSGFVPDHEMTAVRRDGTTFPVSVAWSLMRDARGAPVAVINVVKDMTRLKQAEAALKELSRKIMDAREEEKKRVSQELHDEMGTLAVGLTNKLGLAKKNILAERPGPAAEFIDQSARLLAESVDKIKKIAVDLRPPQLDLIGLPDALREYVENIEKDSGLRIAFKAEVRRGDIPPGSAIALYRVAQEALNNVIKHARAKKAAVELTLDKGRLLFSVRDDGAGFETGPALRNPKSIGLIGMQERIESVHGQLRIRSEINKGTEVRVVLPMKARPAP